MRAYPGGIMIAAIHTGRIDAIMDKRFRARVAVLQRDEPLQLAKGDMQAIADRVGRSASHVCRVLSGERPASPQLAAAIESVVGLPIARIRPWLAVHSLTV